MTARGPCCAGGMPTRAPCQWALQPCRGHMHMTPCARARIGAATMLEHRTWTWPQSRHAPSRCCNRTILTEQYSGGGDAILACPCACSSSNSYLRGHLAQLSCITGMRLTRGVLMLHRVLHGAAVGGRLAGGSRALEAALVTPVGEPLSPTLRHLSYHARTICLQCSGSGAVLRLQAAVPLVQCVHGQCTEACITNITP